MNFIGELSALSASFAWAVCSVITERSSEKARPDDLNFFVKTAGFIMISFIIALSGGSLFPPGIASGTWFWLLISGAIGFALGDGFLFNAYKLLGAKVTLMIFSLAPVLTAILDWLFFGETLTVYILLGMVLVLFGLVLVIMDRSGGTMRLRFPVKGILAAVMASLGQALGIIFSKLGMGSLDALTTTQIRLLGGIIAMLIVYVLRRERGSWQVFKDLKFTGITLFNSFLGTVVGVTLSMVAIAYTQAAVASTLMAVTPIMVLPLSVFFLKQKMDVREIAGAALGVVGIAVLFAL